MNSDTVAFLLDTSRLIAQSVGAQVRLLTQVGPSRKAEAASAQRAMIKAQETHEAFKLDGQTLLSRIANLDNYLAAALSADSALKKGHEKVWCLIRLSRNAIFMP